MRFDVVGIGYPCMDFLVQIDTLPQSDGSCALEDYSWQGGGMVATGLVALSVLGASCAMLGVAGGDSQGRFCVNDFIQNGVDVSHLALDQGGTTDFTIVLSERLKAARSFVIRPGSCRRLTRAELDEALIAGAKYLLVSGMDEVTAAACQIARRHGVQVMVDADTFDRRTVAHLDLIDIFIGSEDFHDAMFPDKNYRENCAAIARMGPRIALTTLGERGVAGVADGAYIEVPAFLSLACADPNGAGDVFHGAFLYALLQGWGPEECARFACAASAIKCTRLGGRAGIADAQTVLRFMESGKVDYTGIDRRVEMYRQGGVL